jgi:hypothetical protein
MPNTRSAAEIVVLARYFSLKEYTTQRIKDINRLISVIEYVLYNQKDLL